MSRKIDLTEVGRIRREGGSDPLEELVDAGRKFYCNLYSSNPYWAMVKKTVIVPVVTRVLNDVCSDSPPPPPPPPPPFEGGQCKDVYYDITVFVDRRFNNNTVNAEYNLNAYGEIKSIELIFQPPQSPNQLAIIATGEPGQQIPSGIDFENVGGVGFSGTIASIEVARADGQPDDCGDPPPPGYDPIPPPTPEDTGGNVTITNNQGDSYDYGVSVNLDTGGTVVFPPVINVGGVSVTIDVGGVTIDNSSNAPSGGGGGGDGDLFAPEESTEKPEVQEEETEEEEEGDIKEVEKLIAIVVNLSRIPTNASVSDGKGAPDIYYAGWVEFKNKGTYYERQFIHFSSSRFNAPEENDGYAITYKEGFAGTVTEITEKTEEPS